MKRLLVGLLLLLNVACSKIKHDRACSNEAPKFKFAHISDTHIGFGRDYKTEQAVAVVNRLKPDFSVFTGDLAHNTEDVTVLGEEQLNTFLSMVSKLESPAYFVPGNHDVGYNNIATSVRAENEALFVAKVGPLNQDFEYQGVRFILVNNNYLSPGMHPMRLEAWQLEWIETVLKENKPTIVMGHVNATENGQLYGTSARRLHALLKRYPKAIGFLHGHLHAGSLSFIEKLVYFGAPSVMGIINGSRATGVGNGQVVEHRVYADRIEACMIPLDGGDSHQEFSQSIKW